MYLHIEGKLDLCIDRGQVNLEEPVDELFQLNEAFLLQVKDRKEPLPNYTRDVCILDA